ncbi:MAG: exodeoxyribonuclease III [Alphaproteobacteria bacterium]|nr:exodeoxyribonuclease III [Alphaproteobacteria bacterium]
MKIASWNVNSIKMRLPIVCDWLKAHSPDVLLLQELKCETDAFPLMEIQSLGYHALVKGQKAYNGVAIITKEKAYLRTDVLDGDDTDIQSRYIEADYNGYIVASIYLPNGNPLGTEKLTYKIGFMKRLLTHAKHLYALEKPVVLGGDYNVIPTDADARHPENWKQDALAQPQSRTQFNTLLHHGYSDAFRALHPNAADAYTFWDYQNGAWPKDDGIRIDHLLTSPEATDKLQKCWIDKGPRGLEKASDHTPIIGEFQPA